MKLKIPIALFSLYSFHLSNTTLLQNYRHKKNILIIKKKKTQNAYIRVEIIESREGLLRRTHCDKGQTSVFDLVMHRELNHHTQKKPKTHIRKTNKKQNPQNKIAQNK